MRLGRMIIKVVIVLSVLAALSITSVICFGNSSDGKNSPGMDILLTISAFAQSIFEVS